MFRNMKKKTVLIERMMRNTMPRYINVMEVPDRDLQIFATSYLPLYNVKFHIQGLCIINSDHFFFLRELINKYCSINNITRILS